MNYTMLHLLFILMLNINPATRSEKLFVASDSLFDNNGILDLGIRDGWRFHAGDDLNWANSNFNDSDWIFYKSTRQGTGLGLSLAYDIVKAHGGEIKVETKESEGMPAGQGLDRIYHSITI